MITSLSGIRGILNEDMTLEDVVTFSRRFGAVTDSKEFLLARDPRSTSPTIAEAVSAALMSEGAKVLDFGIISTPALFRESRKRRRPAVMVTASHNEPEFNGLKFMVDGMGIGREAFDAMMKDGKPGPGPGRFGPGRLRRMPASSYVEDLASRFGAGSCEGVKVALDLGGGAAISHALVLFRRLGCEVVSANDAYGSFDRRVDPLADDLLLLRGLVRKRRCDIGLGFDCDGDRLAVVDSAGKKRSGDFMLTLALSELLRETGEKKVVVSLDTSQAVDAIAKRAGAEVFRSKVGEANVVGLMKGKEARLGGEGSSGGLIDGDFNYCRDSMLAALVIIRAIKRQGDEVYESVPVYHQERTAMKLPRAKAEKAIRSLAKKYKDSDSTDGFKVRVSDKSWVLIRPSGTEDLVRVSAEAESSAKASQLAKSFGAKLKELSR